MAQSTEISAEKLHELSKELSKDKLWHKLLRYHQSKFDQDSFESEVDDANFFVHPEGKTQPQLELQATLHGLTQPASGNTHLQCRFPARFQWLKKNLLNDVNFPTVSCPDLDIFREKYRTKKIAIVFSSYFIGNPGSTFGHTLMKFSLHSNQSSSELLDYGLNSGAEPTTSNPVLYALFGLIGLFKGKYSFFPYYYKIREYNDYESRDLWAYDLNLTQEDMNFILDQVWEIGQTYYDYYFFFENCSYQMMTLIDFKFPEHSPIDDLHFYVIPSDTLRALINVPGLITNWSFRPSAKKNFNQTYFRYQAQGSKLTLFDQLIANPSLPLTETLAETQVQDPQERASLLETVIAYIDFKYADKLMMKDQAIVNWRRQYLLERSKLDVKLPPLDYSYDQAHPPHRGHSSSRLTLWSGYSSKTQALQMVEWKFAFHDLLDSTLGHPKEAQVDFMKARLRINERAGRKNHKLVVDEFSLLEVAAINPYDRFQPMRSWQVNFGAWPERDRNCYDCYTGGLKTSFGQTLGFVPNSPVTLSFFADLFAGLGQSIKGQSIKGQWWRFNFGPKILSRLHASDQWKWLAYGLYHYQFSLPHPHYYEFALESRYSFRDNWALSFKSALRPKDTEAMLGLSWYVGP